MLTKGPSGRATPPLGGRLRAQTRAAHLAAESAFDLGVRLRSPAGYADALFVMEAFHRACDPALAVIAPWLPAALRSGPAVRRRRLQADLRELGREPGLSASPLAVAPGPDAALGVAYVLEGAALGGLVIAAEVRRRLPEAAAATRYFTGEGRATAERWRRFQTVLGTWERRGEAAGAEVVAGALAAFAALDKDLREAP